MHSVSINPPLKMQQSIFLRWKYFQTNISSSLSDLYTETSSTDVTLVSDDQIQFQAHKFVLSAFSPVMKNLLLNNPHSHPLIYLRGVNHQELGSILQFMYHGETSVHQKGINILLENAKELQIKELADCFATANTFDDEHANSTEDAEYDHIRNIEISDNPVSQENDSEYKNNTKSISSTIDGILSLDLATYTTDMDESDSDNQLHKCEECGEGYSWRTALVRHIISKHEGVRYSCNKCVYRTKHKPNLNRHKQAIHEGIKFSCNQCEYQATHQRHLNRHREAMHEGVVHS